MLLGWLLIFAGLGLAYYSISLSRSVAKYEFENMTDGGVIQFESFKQSNWHEFKKRSVKLLWGVAALLVVFGGMVFI